MAYYLLQVTHAPETWAALVDEPHQDRAAGYRTTGRYRPQVCWAEGLGNDDRPSLRLERV